VQATINHFRIRMAKKALVEGKEMGPESQSDDE